MLFKLIKLIIITMLLISGLFADVMNFGKAGDNTMDLLARINYVVDWKPTVVVLMVGTNDFINDRKFVPPIEYKANLLKIVNSFDCKVIVCTILPADASKGFFDRHKMVNYRKSLDSLVCECNNIIRSCGFDLLDVYSNYGKDLLFDGIHPNDAGLALIAELVAKKLDKNYDTSRVACFGDSITEAVYTEESYPVKLTRLIYK